jgi:branched-chain amino acid transport system permease protein
MAAIANVVKGKRRIILSLVALLASLTVFPYVISVGFTSLLIVLLMYVTMSAAWDLLGGYIGDLSFGHAAFYGIGAYTYGLLVYYGISSFAAINIVMGGVTAMAFAVLFGIPFQRLTGLYFAIGTLGISQVLRIAFENSDFTLRTHGVIIPMELPYSIIPYYYSILLITIGALALIYVITRSKVGIALMAIRDDPSASQMLGINVTFYRILSLSISGFIVGIVGGFFAYFNHYVFPSGVFSLDLSFEILTMALFGGSGIFSGPIIGAIVVFFVEELGRQFIQRGFLLLLSVMLMIVFLLMPGGVVGTLSKQSPFVNPLDLLKRRRRDA